uniref:Putative secreted peptide n=1 Tax=Anopheles braziliensis TaxID=58242 RepID=A0A2M3ZNB5_9DIPT
MHAHTWFLNVGAFLFGMVAVAMVPPRLHMDSEGLTFIKRGEIDVIVMQDFKQTERGLDYLRTILALHEGQCRKLMEIMQHDRCAVITSMLTRGVNEYGERLAYLASFFPARRARGILSYLGVMDGDDRVQIDSEVVTMHQNEEKLREAYSHITRGIFTKQRW